MPYILPSTTYGNRMVERYTLAWFQRYLSPDASTRAGATTTLLNSPKRAVGTNIQAPWRADFMSARYAGGFWFHDTVHQLHQTKDLRAYGGASRVGDWSGANSNQPVVAP